MNRVLLALAALVVVVALAFALWPSTPASRPPRAARPASQASDPAPEPAPASQPPEPPPRRTRLTAAVPPPPAAQLDPPIPQDRAGVRRLITQRAPRPPGVGDTMNADAPPSEPMAMRREAIREAIQQATPAIGGCYEQILARNPEAAGLLKVQFKLVAEGGVARLKDAEITEDSLGDPFLGMCALKAIADLTFEAEADGEVVVNYPFILKPAVGDEPEDAP